MVSGRTLDCYTGFRPTFQDNQYRPKLCMHELFSSRAGLRNVRTCSAEQSPPHFMDPHICVPKIYEVIVAY